MPPRKTFRPDKNRGPGRTGSGPGRGQSDRPEGARAKGSGFKAAGAKRPANRDSQRDLKRESHRESGRDSRAPRREERETKFQSPVREGKFVARDRDERADRPARAGDRGRVKAPAPQPPANQTPKPPAANIHGPKGSYWVYGHHAVLGAIDNPKRRVFRLLQTAGTGGERAVVGGSDRPLPAWEIVDRAILDRVAGRESVHQGIAAQVETLPEVEIEDIAALAEPLPSATVVILDQVTDPHNVGAILRSAAAFGALAVILTERNAAPESGVLAKAASGALEIVPVVRVINLARAMEQLKAAGFWCVGLAAEAERTLAEARLSGRVALCLGGEGPGLRRLTRAHCDLLAKLPTSGPIDHLNVSNAAAVALYELARGQ